MTKKILTLISKNSNDEYKLSFEELGNDDPTYKEVEKFLLRNNELIRNNFNGIVFEYLNMSGKYISLNEKNKVREQAFRVNYIFYISTKRPVITKNRPIPQSPPPPLREEKKQEPTKNLNETKIIVQDEIKPYQEKIQNNDTSNINYTKPFEYAGFGLRFGAILLDGLIIGLPLKIFGNIFSAIGDEADSVYTLITIVIYWLYFAIMESSKNQATLGKKILKIKVVDMNGNKVSFARATGRHFGKILSSFILLIGFFMAGFTEKKQTLHDIMAQCLVIKE